jgi:AGCS family alanine or glycine:cation symporter
MSFVESVVDVLDLIISTVSGYVWGWPEALPLIVVILLGTGIITTFRLGWVQIRRFWHGIRVIRGEFDDPEHEGDISHFQALSTALSATVGIGNIAGVATAIHYGGPGALFWMWVTAVFGMALKYTECTLSMRYRSIFPDGSAAGGPMYSIERGLGRGWKPLAVIFALFAAICSFGTGNAVQSFTVADQFRQDLGFPTWLVGLVMASLIALVILGGIKRIGRVTSRLVPFMAVLYVLAGLLVLLFNAGKVPAAIAEVVTSAFTPAAEIGGFAGGGFIFMLVWGVKRGLFSNESGQGSAPIAHAAAKTDEPVREGMVAMLGPFVDTLLVCTMTGLVIVTTGAWRERVPDVVRVNEQADLVAIVDDADVQKNGVIRTEDRATGRFEVAKGEPLGLLLVRNHSTVAEAELRFATEDILREQGKPFDGFIEFEEPGQIARAKLFDRAGDPEPEELVLHGRMMQNGSPLTGVAFRQGLSPITGNYGHYLITIAVFLFGLSTAISWSYYGDRSVLYLFGSSWVIPYRVVFCVVHFLAAIFSLELVWAFGDMALGLMTVPNLLSILLLTSQVKRWTREYETSGKLEPTRRG